MWVGADGLLRVAGVSNFVISDELTSMITTHLARNPDLRHFWIENVFSDGKFEIDIVPVDRCVDCTSEIEWVDRTRHVLRSAPVASRLPPGYGWAHSAGGSKRSFVA